MPSCWAGKGLSALPLLVVNQCNPSFCRFEMSFVSNQTYHVLQYRIAWLTVKLAGYQYLRSGRAVLTQCGDLGACEEHS